MPAKKSVLGFKDTKDKFVLLLGENTWIATRLKRS